MQPVAEPPPAPAPPPAASADAQAAAPPGTQKVKRVGNYLLAKTVGEGTFGKVKLATHTVTGLRVAVKVLEKDRIVESADMERITREIHILKLLSHPNIIRLYEVIDTQKHIYLIMEFADGGELFDYIVHHTRVKEKEACKFFHQILAGVDYCHQHSIIHRDLKPENLLLDHSRNIKIIDFGLSNKIKMGNLLKTACGSPCYAAPEMIEGKAYVGQASDIWSCGVILFALVCGYLPFEDGNTQALYQKILHGRYRCPSFLSPECKDLIGKILCVDPTRRYTIEKIRQHPWFVDNYSGPPDPVIPLTPETMEIDPVLLEDMVQFGYNKQYVVQCLRGNKHNQVTATYHLLAEKKVRDRIAAGLDPFAPTAPAVPLPMTAAASDRGENRPLPPVPGFVPPPATAVAQQALPPIPLNTSSESNNTSAVGNPASKAPSVILATAPLPSPLSPPLPFGLHANNVTSRPLPIQVPAQQAPVSARSVTSASPTPTATVAPMPASAVPPQGSPTPPHTPPVCLLSPSLCCVCSGRYLLLAHAHAHAMASDLAFFVFVSAEIASPAGAVEAPRTPVMTPSALPTAVSPIDDGRRGAHPTTPPPIRSISEDGEEAPDDAMRPLSPRVVPTTPTLPALSPPRITPALPSLPAPSPSPPVASITARRRHSMFPNSAIVPPAFAAAGPAGGFPGAAPPAPVPGMLPRPHRTVPPVPIPGVPEIPTPVRTPAARPTDLQAVGEDEEDMAPPAVMPLPRTAVPMPEEGPAEGTPEGVEEDDEGDVVEATDDQMQQMAAAAAASRARRRVSIAADKDAADALAAIMQSKGPAQASDPRRDVRVFRGLFNVSKALRKRRIVFKRLENSYTLKCEHMDRGLRFELEVCRLPRLEGVCFVNMKRISGDTFAWKEFCSQLFNDVKL
ncbi:putative SNF1-related protein kinase catalytic subunit alpha KIN10 [Paratrimastix pyriformis]|uniref:non-specific serine/threonine protein kinase n=1 Tax=Paratrimastix pyriformis TaxID=342808 RepID=A0ABQ8UBR8_9EUKA|nr:putative SNF1-related protein kinase catalytic subunit alpha KIN10 [Paratrimastix pyriformis]